MKRFRLATLLTTWLVSCVCAFAQEVFVTVTPVQQVLPPQVLLYMSDPEKYFTITLTNTTSDVQQVYLGLQLEQIIPASDLAIATPAHRQPNVPYIIQPNSVYTLSSTEMKNMFNHIPASEIQCPANLFDDYTSGAFGLLPEGTYRAKVTAYRWENPQLKQPVVVNNPEGGWCTFEVCYKAQAPQFLTPMINMAGDETVAQVDPLTAQFTWTTPVTNCGVSTTYTYDITIVELLPGQQPDVAMDRNPVVYQAKGILPNMCIISPQIVTSNFYADRTYLAQVRAVAKANGPLSYVVLENNGKSTYLPFKFKTNNSDDDKNDDKDDEEDDDKDDDKGDDKDDEDEKGEDLLNLWGDGSVTSEIDSTAMYKFRNPTITTPTFSELSARKQFLRSDMAVAWHQVWHLGGQAAQADTLKFDYEVQLFNGKTTIDRKAALETEPIYTKLIRGTQALSDTILWSKIEDKVNEKDYLVLRVKPICTNFSDSIVFQGDSLNVVDFALVDAISKSYFQCSNMVELDNENPTTAKADDLKGKTIPIGEYMLTIDEIKAGKKADTWEGKGKVEWNPLGTKVMVCVKFEDLKINTDLVVFDGTAKTYSADPQSNNDIVEKLFSDWGIDNLIADTGIPYANELQSATTDGVKSLAEKINLSQYYEYYVKGEHLWNMIGSQDIEELYLPIALPEGVTSQSPVDVQISTMKFAATHATMDIIGEFVMPDCDVLDNQILVFGAPRICISPDRILPESGTLALLSDFKVTDPNSDYECTFKAPKDVINPTDGCYVSWHDDAFEMLGIDVDMKIPGLKKDVNGVAQDECPVFNIKTSISDWDDWMVDNVTIDPFQAEDLPGWTFTVQNVVYDHSLSRNSTDMGKFPAKYDQKKTTYNGNVNTWQGLYIKEIGVKMPKSLEFGTDGDKRLSIAAKNMFFDRSGATLEIGADDILSAKTGKAGGWSFSLDKVHATFIQNDFSECGFSGRFDVPLLEGQMGYACQILKVNDLENSPAGNYAYVFKVQQMDDLSLDFFLATANFDEDLTYMLVEAVPEQNELKTRVELLMSGDMTIGGDAMKEKMKSSLGFELPGIHFSKMRLANCPAWESQFEDIKKLQTAKDTNKPLANLYEGKELNVKDQLYFSTGQWSLASFDKKLGPFEFSVTKYNIDYKDELLGLSVEGEIKLLEGLDISASAGFTINAKLSGITSLASDFDFSKIDLSYESTKFDKAGFNTSFAGITLKGELEAVDDETNGKGYSGMLEFTMPGELFTAKANGGYYKLDDYRWGYFYTSVGGAAGIQIPPIEINDISAGFYFNCVRKGKTEAEPRKDIIGVVAGMGIASSGGKDVIGGDFEMTVVYDKKNKRLTTFMLTGHLSAVAGMISSDASIVWQDDDTDKYFALNVTVDAADGGGISEKVTALSKDLAEKQKALNDKVKTAVNNAKGGLQGALNDTSDSKAGEKTENKMPEKPKVGELDISLDFRITMKEKGKKLDKTKWHLYLGQPDEDKRCSFTLVDFKSPGDIVRVNIGANAYLCVGNELPNNGELPPLPEKIRTFLDDSTKGSGVESDDVAKAEKARQSAKKYFESQANGGVMLGASAWGYINVDLGLFYADLGALAGFDVSVRNIGSTPCMNIDRTPGFNGWYAEGQLYAYLYAVMGLKIDLGFWSEKFNILDAGIGGVLRMGLPNPSYFTGQARVKLNLLNGLVKINRKFEFECGDRCDIFYGNALDNFKLFGDCSVGDTIQAKGWNKENAINPNFYMPVSVNTEAPIREHFRVLDETELNRLAEDFDGDKEQLKSQASRTFIFNTEKKVTIYEYSSANQNINSPSRTHYFKYKGNARFQHPIDMTQLNPNKYYRLRVEGWAKEIENGQEVDPLKWNNDKKKYENVPWKQTVDYFFCTGQAEAIEDCPEDIQQYVAIAYPSDYNKLQSENEIPAYVSDIKSPNIAFFSDISTQAFKKGKLTWRLLKEVKGGNYQLLEKRNATWVVTDSTCNLAVSGKQFESQVRTTNRYRLQLYYETSRTETVYEVQRSPQTKNLRATKAMNPQTQEMPTLVKTEKIVTDSTCIADLILKPYDTYYHTGYVDGKGIKHVPYEMPFVGIRLNSVKTKTSDTRYSGRMLYGYKTLMTNDGKAPLRYQDPYTYIGYMSNFGLVGGWNLTNKRLSSSATTAQSLIYCDRGGVYEGSYRDSDGSNLDYSKIKSMSLYDRSQWGNDCEYPLPVMTDAKYNYAIGGRERASVLNLYQNDDERRAINLIGDIYDVYSAVDEFDSKFRKELQSIMHMGSTTFSTSNANAVEKEMLTYAGTYITGRSKHSLDVYIEVPYYQLGILWGSQFNNKESAKKVTMWGSFDDIPKTYLRPQEDCSEDILLGLVGNNSTKLLDVDHAVIGRNSSGSQTMVTTGPYIDFIPYYDNIKEISVTYYRVNAYNFKKGEYTVGYRSYLNMGPIHSEVTYTIKDPGKYLKWSNTDEYTYKNK